LSDHCLYQKRYTSVNRLLRHPWKKEEVLCCSSRSNTHISTMHNKITSVFPQRVGERYLRWPQFTENYKRNCNFLRGFQLQHCLTGWPRRLAARTARRLVVLNCVACATLIHTFVSVAGRAAVHRCAWLNKYIAMPLFQSLDASPFAPREYSHQRMSRDQAVMVNP
jgi:hypothetical protein